MIDEEPLRFGILGPVCAWRGDTELHLGPAKHRALLAVLLLNANCPVGHREIVDALWETQAPPSATNLVHKYASGLRRALGTSGGQLLTVLPGSGYRLQARGHVDVDEFDARLHRARTLRAHDPGAAATEFAAADALWRGPALTGLSGHAFDVARHRLEERHILAVEERHAVELELGGHAEAVAELAAFGSQYPLRERVHELLMLALYRCGRVAEALAVFRELRERLVEQLGIEPSSVLADLHQRILRSDTGTALMPAATSFTTAAFVPAQLPPTLPDFTGRAREIGELSALGHAETGAGPRLAVVVGPGGMGKSALATHVAHLIGDRFPDGQLYANLRGAQGDPVSPTTVLFRFLRDLGTPASAIPDDEESRTATLRTTLSSRHLLILLDDAHNAAQIRPLLPGGANCLVMVTSRNMLVDLAGARPFTLEPLSSADGRAMLTRTLGPVRVAAESTAIDQIVQASAGLPLALRIIGARLASRPSWKIAILTDRLADTRRRLGELAAGDLEIRASFETSLKGLPPAVGPGQVDPAVVFRRLGLLDIPDVGVSVAAHALGLDEATTEAAMEVLVDAFLMSSPAPGRYRYHDLLHLFAREKSLQQDTDHERQAVLTRLLGFAAVTAHNAGQLLRPTARPLANLNTPATGLTFTDRQRAQEWMDAEGLNLLAVARQAATDPHVDCALLGTLVRPIVANFTYTGYWSDCRDVLAMTLAAVRRSGNQWMEADMEQLLGVFCRRQHRLNEAAGHYQRAWTLAEHLGDTHLQVSARHGMGITYCHMEKTEIAVTYLRESLELAKRLSDERGEMRILNNLAKTYQQGGDLPTALEYAKRSQALQERVGQPADAPIRLYTLGSILSDLGRHDEAIEVLEKALPLARSHRNVMFDGLARVSLAQAHVGRSEYVQAVAYSEEALRQFDHIGYQRGSALANYNLGIALIKLEQRHLAREHLQRALSDPTALRSQEADRARMALATLDGISSAAGPGHSARADVHGISDL